PSFERPTQSENPILIPSVCTRQFHPPGRVGANDTPIRSLFGILDPRVACFDPLPWVFLDPSFERPTQTGNPIRIPSVRTRQFHLPSCVGANDTPIRSLFGILDPWIACSNPLPWICHLNANPIRESNSDSVSSHTSLSPIWSCWSEWHADQIPILFILE
ncbi:hypothetical protein Taro_024561, partial [Colocasia esculenta]|nr:hypothetical protein [Colocasia esculenta]